MARQYIQSYTVCRANTFRLPYRGSKKVSAGISQRILTKEETEPTEPSLTASVAFWSFGSQIWEGREPGSPCSSPCLEHRSCKLGMKEHSGEKRKRRLLTGHSELAPVIKTTRLPRGGAPPSHLASSPVCSNRAGWLGWEEMPAGRQQAGDPKRASEGALSSGLGHQGLFPVEELRAHTCMDISGTQ